MTLTYREQIEAQVTAHFDEAKQGRDQARQRAEESQATLEQIADTMRSLGMEVPDMSQSFPLSVDAAGLGEESAPGAVIYAEE